MSEDLRNEFIAAKVTAKEKKTIERAAKRQGMDTSNYVRWKLIYKDKEGGGGQ